MNKYNRKQLRLYGYDYSLNGAYFITICTEKRKKILCDINVGEGLSPLPIINLSDIGKEVQRSVEFINQNTPNVTIDKYVIMPNHIHMIVIIDNEQAFAVGFKIPQNAGGLFFFGICNKFC